MRDRRSFYSLLAIILVLFLISSIAFAGAKQVGEIVPIKCEGE